MRLRLEHRVSLDRIGRKVRIVALAAVVLAGAAGIGCGKSGDSGNSGPPPSLVEERQREMKRLADEASGRACTPADPKRQAPGAIRESLMTLLAYPQQAGPYLEPQLLGKARLELYQVDDREVYFYLPPAESSGEGVAQAICRLAVNKARVEVGKEKEGKFEFANYSFLRTPEKAIFLRVTIDNLRLEADTPLRFPFKQAAYAPTLEEVHYFMRNESVIGGRVEAVPDSQAYGQPTLYNYGAVVAKAGEPSLQRFVADLTRDIAAADAGAREQKIQRLADLISREIAPNPEEAPLNIVKRASEALMTGLADYRNRAVLLGSLLEQMQEDYLFVYAKDYLAVAVKQGRFPALTENQLKWDGTDWQLIDLTSPGFRIGQDALKKLPGRTKYIQRPRQNSVIVNLATGAALSFN